MTFVIILSMQLSQSTYGFSTIGSIHSLKKFLLIIFYFIIFNLLPKIAKHIKFIKLFITPKLVRIPALV